MEHKTCKTVVLNTNEAEGIVECIFSVFGVLDSGNDIVHGGAFTKTWNERGNKIRLLDSHDTKSVLSALGKPLEFRELRRAELPQAIMDEYPEATGGAWAKVQFNMKTDAGRDAFWHVANGDVDEWSYGYDAVDKDHTKINYRGKEVIARNLRGIKQYELSPVIFGMLEATLTTDAKAAPSEAKPYSIVEEDGQFCVYRVDADGKPMGKPMGKHPTEAEARAQMRAIMANEEEGKAVTRSEGDGDHPASHYLVVEDSEKPTTWHLRVRNAAGEVDHRLMGAAWAALHSGYRGNVYEGPGKAEAIRKLTALYDREGLTPPGKSGDEPDEEKAGRVLSARNAKRIKAAMDELHQCLMEAGLMEMPDDDTGPHKSEEPPTPSTEGAGTNEDQSTRFLKLIDLELENLEV